MADVDGLPAPQYTNASLADAPAGPLRQGKNESRSAGFLRKRAFSIFAIVAAAAGIIVGIIFFKAPNFAEGRDSAISTKEAEISLTERRNAGTAALRQALQKALTPTLSVKGGSGEVNVPLPLGIDVTNYASGSIINFSGLLAGTVMSAGAASGEGIWSIAVDDLPKALVIPPRDYVGPMTIIAELHGSNGEAIVRSPVRYIWKQDAAESSKTLRPRPSAVDAIATSGAEAPRQIDPREAAALLKRAEELLSNGDVPAARLLLQRAAEAHNPLAAFELGATYDPIVLSKRGGLSIESDLTLAKTWYQKAREWGSSDASARLEALASKDR